MSTRNKESMPNIENVIPDHTRPQGTTVPSHGHDHEYRDINFRGMVKFGIYLVILAVVVHVAIWLMFEVLENHAEKGDETASVSPLAKGPQQPPPPRLQSSPGTDMAKYRVMEDSALHGYAWLDRGTGRARIPIDRAIDIIAQRGLPTRTTIELPPASDSTAAGAGAPQTGDAIERGEEDLNDTTMKSRTVGGRESGRAVRESAPEGGR